MLSLRAVFPIIALGVVLPLLSAAPLSGARADAPPPLPALGGNAKAVSVSGLSSGAFQAIQYDVAFSASSIGVGVVAGGPYNCAYVNWGGIVTCMSGNPTGQASYMAAKGFADLNSIDPVSHLAAQKVYLFSGTNDTTVHQSVVNAVYDFFKMSGVPVANISYEKSYPAGHAFIAPSYGNLCNTTATPYVDECPLQSGGAKAGAAQVNYDQPGAILARLYGGPLNPPSATLSSAPQAFNQREFADEGSSMDSTGYVYIPKACTASGAACAVHVVLHGCQQGASIVGDAVYGKVGYNAWADSNKIIVLYPQAVISQPLNPQGCWDWWGYTGANFQVKSGVQLSAIKAMVDRLTGTAAR